MLSWQVARNPVVFGDGQTWGSSSGSSLLVSLSVTVSSPRLEPRAGFFSWSFPFS